MKPKTSSTLPLALLTAACLLQPASFLLAQGFLTPPPGAPAPTMKTLDQVEPRIPITSVPINITQSGSYYLTQSFAQNFNVLHAISILADNVTVDFCGFTIQQTTANVGIVGVTINSTTANTALRNAVVRNGTLTGFTGSGLRSLGGRNCLIEDFHITVCGGGISFQAFGPAGAAGNTFRRCRFTDNGGSGIVIISGAANFGNVIENCESLNNSTGFALAAAGNLIIGCRASGNAGNYTIAAGNRMGLIVFPGPNAAQINGSSGATGTGTSDPFANLSY